MKNLFTQFHSEWEAERRTIVDTNICLDLQSSSTLGEHFLKVILTVLKKNFSGEFNGIQKTLITFPKTIKTLSDFYLFEFISALHWQLIKTSTTLRAEVTKNRYENESSSVRDLRISQCGTLKWGFLSSFHVSREK